MFVSHQLECQWEQANLQHNLHRYPLPNQQRWGSHMTPCLVLYCLRSYTASPINTDIMYRAVYTWGSNIVIYIYVHNYPTDYIFITFYLFLFIYCHLYSAFSIVQCSNALYRLWDGEIQGHTGQPSVREIDAHAMYNSMSNRSWPKPQLS